MAQAPDAEYGFRSLALYSDEACTIAFGLSPLLLDVDLDGDEPEAAAALVARIEATLNARGWRYRVFSSGEGFHVEVDPVTTHAGMPCPPAWWVDQELQELRDETDGRLDSLGGRALIDKRHAMVRMVGSGNRKGGTKTLLHTRG